MIYFTDENWNNGEIAVTDGLLIVKVSASWCGPCKSYAPIFEEFAKNNTDPDVQFAEADADENEKLVQHAGIRGVPTTLFYNKGALVNKVSGIIDSSKLTELIAETKAK